MFLPPERCGLIIDKGEDFPPAFEKQILSMGTDMTWFRPRNGKTSRALNIYSGTRIGCAAPRAFLSRPKLMLFLIDRDGHQSFEYLSPQLHLTPKDLVLPPSPFTDPLPEWLHVVCVTERAQTIADELEAVCRGDLGVGKGWKPKTVWEPLGVSSFQVDGTRS